MDLIRLPQRGQRRTIPRVCVPTAYVPYTVPRARAWLSRTLASNRRRVIASERGCELDFEITHTQMLPFEQPFHGPSGTLPLK